MSKAISATYEGDRLIRLDEVPSDLEPSSCILVLLNPDKELPAAVRTGADALHERLNAFEKQYAMESGDFYERYQRGELGDERDFVVWAGLLQILERMRK